MSPHAGRLSVRLAERRGRPHCHAGRRTEDGARRRPGCATAPPRPRRPRHPHVHPQCHVPGGAPASSASSRTSAVPRARRSPGVLGILSILGPDYDRSRHGTGPISSLETEPDAESGRSRVSGTPRSCASPLLITQGPERRGRHPGRLRAAPLHHAGPPGRGSTGADRSGPGRERPPTRRRTHGRGGMAVASASPTTRRRAPGQLERVARSMGTTLPRCRSVEAPPLLLRADDALLRADSAARPFPRPRGSLGCGPATACASTSRTPHAGRSADPPYVEPEAHEAQDHHGPERARRRTCRSASLRISHVSRVTRYPVSQESAPRGRTRARAVVPGLARSYLRRPLRYDRAEKRTTARLRVRPQSLPYDRASPDMVARAAGMPPTGDERAPVPLPRGASPAHRGRGRGARRTRKAKSEQGAPRRSVRARDQISTRSRTDLDAENASLGRRAGPERAGSVATG